MASPTPPPSVPASSKPSSSLSPSAHHIKAAENLLRENKLICQRLFSYDQDDEPQDKHTLEAARQRKHIQLTHSPYAPRKRARYNPAVSLESNEQSTISSPSKQLTETNQPSEQQQQQQQKQHQQPLDLVSRSKAIAQEDDKSLAVPHLKWKPYRIISGHLGWVRSIEFDPSNAWFATGSSDRTIKVWDSASGKLKLTLTGHIAAPRSLSISSKYPYLFSVSEDKTVKCWDLEQNKVIRNYHGHLSGVYTCALHPTLDILFTGGRDSTIRVWDIRTRKQIHVFSGHRDTINDLFSLPIDPQVVSSSIDSTIRLWDLRNLKCQSILTNHKKGVRAIVKHPREFSFTSASIDSIKSWALPDGIFMRDFKAKVDNRVEKAHGGKLVNALAVNEDNVVVSGGDDGILRFWDYKSASMFDEMKSTVQPGSLECEASIQCLSFDKSGSRLVTGETDKTIRMYREV